MNGFVVAQGNASFQNLSLLEAQKYLLLFCVQGDSIETRLIYLKAQNLKRTLYSAQRML